MAFDLTELDVFSPSVRVPEDGFDRRTAASLQPAFQALTNRTKNLDARLVALSGQVAGHTTALSAKDTTRKFAFGHGLGSAPTPAASGAFNYFSTRGGIEVCIHNPVSPRQATLTWVERLRLPAGAVIKGWRARMGGNPNFAGLSVTTQLRRFSAGNFEDPSAPGTTAVTLSTQTVTDFATNSVIVGESGLTETVSATDLHSLSFTFSVSDAATAAELYLRAYELTWTQPAVGT